MEIARKPASVAPPFFKNLYADRRLINKGVHEGSANAVQNDRFEQAILPSQNIPLSSKIQSAAASGMSVGARLERARGWQAAGQYGKAISILNVSQVKQSSNQAAIKELGTLLLKTRQYMDAERLMAEALQRYPNQLEFRYFQAYALYGQQKYVAALRLMQQENPELSSHLDYYALLAQLFVKNQQAGMAVSFYRLLLSHQPNNAKWWLGVAIASQQQGKFISAQGAFQRALSVGHLPATAIAYIQQQLQRIVYADPV